MQITKKKLINIVLSLILSANVMAQQKHTNNDYDTRLYLVGTMHQDFARFTTDDLVSIFRKIKPDVILVERDSSMLTKDNWYPKVISPELEQRAVTIYRKESDFIILPYEYEGRNAYKRKNEFKKNDTLLFTEIKQLKSKRKLSDDSLRWLKEVDLATELVASLLNESACVFNSDTALKVVKQRKNRMYNNISLIIKDNAELAEFESHWKRVIDFWHIRNKSMAENIIRHYKNYTGKKILVLNGFSHKYLLTHHLTEEGIPLSKFCNGSM